MNTIYYQPQNICCFRWWRTIVLVAAWGVLVNTLTAQINLEAPVRWVSSQRAIAFAPGKPSLCVFAGDNGSVFSSSDGGVTRYLRPTPLSTHFFSTGAAFADTSTVVVIGGTPSNILRSTDSGITWSVITPPISPSLQLNSITFYNSLVGCIGGQNHILRTADGGATWSVVSTAGGFWNGIAFSPGGSVGIAVSSSGGILRSTDGGVTWSAVPSPTINWLAEVRFASATWVVAVGNNGTVIRSNDAGLTWSLVTVPTTAHLSGLAFATSTVGVAVGYSLSSVLYTSDGGATWSFGASIGTGLVKVNFGSATDGWVVGDNAMLRTTDAGLTWTPVAGMVLAPHSVAFGSATDALMVGSLFSSNVARTTDGGNTWTGTPIFDNLNDVAYASSAVAVVVGDFGDIFRTTTGGGSWIPIPSPVATHLRGLAFSSPSVGVAVGASGTIIRTSTAGTSWSVVPSPTSSTLNRVAFAAGGLGLAVGNGGVLLRSTDAGASWALVPSPVTANLMDVAFLSPGTAIAVGASGTLLRTTDGGLSWSVLTSPVTTLLRGIAAAGPTAALVCGEAGTLLYTTDGGTTWSYLGNFANLNFRKIALSPSGGILVARLDGGPNYSGVFKVDVTGGLLGPLPLEILSWRAVRTSTEAVTLSWQTANEQGTKYFEVEYSPDGIRFEPMGRVAARGGTASEVRQSYEHRVLQRSSGYFRLRSHRADDTDHYTDIVFVRGSELTESVLYYPNPLTNSSVLTVLAPCSDPLAHVQLLDLAGRVVLQQACPAGTCEVDVSNVSAGMYLLQVSACGSTWVEKLAR